MTSTIAEMVEEEAAAAEAEEEEAAEVEAEEEVEPEPDEEAEPEARAPLVVDEKAFEREQKRHEGAMGKLLGDAFSDLTHCEACGATGYVPKDQVALPDVKDDPELLVCEGCNGWGLRRTPSLKADYDLLDCTACGGRGYETRDERRSREMAESYQHPAPAVQTTATHATAPQLRWNGEKYTWETPDGTPVYGLAPPTS